MSEKASAIVKVNLPSERISETIQRALEPETMSSLSNRSWIKLSREGKTVMLVFEADDTTALRASMNSYLSWLYLLLDLCSPLET